MPDWSKPLMETSTGQRSLAGTPPQIAELRLEILLVARSTKLLHKGHSRRLIAFAPQLPALTAPALWPGWFKPPTGPCTGQRRREGPTAMARSSACRLLGLAPL